MIELKKYTDEDWIAIKDAVEPFAPLELPEEFVGIANRSLAVTGLEDGEVMACGGITFLSNDEGVVWCKVSEKCRKNAYGWARTIIDSFRIMMESVENLKVVAYVTKDFCRGMKLARTIGLKDTGELLEYNGKTYHTYSTVT